MSLDNFSRNNYLNKVQCFGRAIEVAPSVGHSKYMYMGQLMTGDVAVQCFTKGIEIMKKVLKAQQKQVNFSNFGFLKTNSLIYYHKLPVSCSALWILVFVVVFLVNSLVNICCCCFYRKVQVILRMKLRNEIFLVPTALLLKCSWLMNGN